MSLQYFSEKFGCVMGSIPDYLSATMPVPMRKGIAVVYYHFCDSTHSAPNRDVDLVTAALMVGDQNATPIPVSELFQPPSSIQAISRTGNDVFALSYKKKQMCCERLAEMMKAGLYDQDNHLHVSEKNAESVAAYIDDVRSFADVVGLQALYSLLLQDLTTKPDREEARR